jgi:hypothetical protein
MVVERVTDRAEETSSAPLQNIFVVVTLLHENPRTARCQQPTKKVIRKLLINEENKIMIPTGKKYIF